MPRSPWERERKREQAANAKVLDLYMSSKHICLCTHVQGFHWDNGVGRCVDAECGCEAFDEDVFASAVPSAAQPPATNPAGGHDAGAEDALARAMRAEMQHEVSDYEVWDRALRADRPRPTGKPRPSTRQDPAVLDALREIGGSPEDVTG